MVVFTSVFSFICFEFVRCWFQENLRFFIRFFSEMARFVSFGISSFVSVCELFSLRFCLSFLFRLLFELQDRNSFFDGFRSFSRFLFESFEFEFRVFVRVVVVVIIGFLSFSCSWFIRQRRNFWVFWNQGSRYKGCFWGWEEFVISIYCFC